MKSVSLWIIRAALVVQFIGVLAVPAIVLAAESPRAIWIGEWLNPQRQRGGLSAVAPEREGRTIGILKLRDGRLSFTEQAGQAEWAIDLASVKRVTVSGKTLTIESIAGDAYEVAVMEPNLLPGSPKKVAATIDKAMQTLTAVTR